jgi:hypothetical protein
MVRWGGVDGGTLPPHPLVPLQTWEANMNLRDQVEAVLRKHCVVRLAERERSTQWNRNIEPVLNDLLTCFPQQKCETCGRPLPKDGSRWHCAACECPQPRPKPSRETLEKVLQDCTANTSVGTSPRCLTLPRSRWQSK